VEHNDLVKVADFITVHVPLTDETTHMIGAEQFALMKKMRARAELRARRHYRRGAALLAGIKEGKVAGAALDVFENEPPTADNEFLKIDNVITTCHLGASTEEAQVNVALEIAECVKDFLLGKGIRNAANYPSIDAELYKALKPYIFMSEKLGNFAAQFIEGRISDVRLQYSGENHEIRPVVVDDGCHEGHAFARPERDGQLHQRYSPGAEPRQADQGNQGHRR
jgi:D-3-phosphoglycerate dehydrogenase